MVRQGHDRDAAQRHSRPSALELQPLHRTATRQVAAAQARRQGNRLKSKSGLLDAALVPPPGWAEAIAAAAATPIQRRGAALLQTMIAAWEAPASEEFLRSTILTAAHEPIALQRLAANFAVHILDAVSSPLDGDERLVRASLAATQIVGLAMMRYVWKVGAIATIPSDQAIALVAPTVQRYLNGRLSGLDQ